MLRFIPNGRFVYCIHELDCTIDVFAWSLEDGKASMKLMEKSVISTLAAGVAVVGNTGCEVIVSDDGRFVYACTRGVDEITVYRVNEATGLLTEQQRISCGGKTPRMIALDPSRRWLLSCNQAGPGSLTVFAHSPQTGLISDTPQTYLMDTPMCTVWGLMFARKVKIECVGEGGALKPAAIAWIDNFAMRNFTNDAIFDDTLPIADGLLEIGSRVPVVQLEIEMEQWFRRKGYLKVGERLRVTEVMDSGSIV